MVSIVPTIFHFPLCFSWCPSSAGLGVQFNFFFFFQFGLDILNPRPGLVTQTAAKPVRCVPTRLRFMLLDPYQYFDNPAGTWFILHQPPVLLRTFSCMHFTLGQLLLHLLLRAFSGTHFRLGQLMVHLLLRIFLIHVLGWVNVGAQVH